MHLALSKKQIEQLQSLCDDAELNRALTPAILTLIYKKKWFKLFVPVEQGGLALNLHDALKYEEELAYIDGSLGWTVTLCAGANFFVGYVEKNMANKIFRNKKVCLGGSGAIGGTAEQVGDGYIVNGFWSYATGAPHLTHFTANCIIKKNGKAVTDKEGRPMIQSFLFKKSEVAIHEDWNTMGLIATASHSFSVHNLKLGANRSFIIDPAHTTLNDLIYKYPFLPFAQATTAVNTLGMARHFIDEAETIIEKKYYQKKIITQQYGVSMHIVKTARQKISTQSNALYTSVRVSWNELTGKGQVSKKTANKIATTSHHLVKVCRNCITELYPHCGLFATASASQINRIFRDVFTASQHSLLIS